MFFLRPVESVRHMFFLQRVERDRLGDYSLVLHISLEPAHHIRRKPTLFDRWELSEKLVNLCNECLGLLIHDGRALTIKLWCNGLTAQLSLEAT